MARPTRRRVGSARAPRRALLALFVVLTATACGGDVDGTPNAGPAPPSVVATPTDPPVEVLGLPSGVELVVSEPATGVETGDNLTFVSPVFALTPAGPLDRPVTVRMRLDNALPTATPILAASRATPDQPWGYLPGVLTSDQQHVEFATSRLDEFGILSIDREGALASLLGDIRGGMASRIDRKLEKPVCAGEEAARKGGYTVAASKTKTLLWCFGIENDKRVVKITNRRLTPVEVAHPKVEVLQNPATAKAWKHWSGALGSANTFLTPGRSATYDADLEPVTGLLLNAESATAGQSLRLMQATVRAMVLRLTAFGLGRANVVKTVSTLLARPRCAKTLSKGSEALIARCFAKPQLVATFGSRGLLLAPLVSAPAFPVFVKEQAQKLTAQARTTERQRILVRRAAPDFTAFTHLWWGPSRSLTIDGGGLAVERRMDDLGGRIIDVTYQLEDPETEAGTSTAATTVVAVHVSRPKYVTGRVPRVGQTGTIRLREGVISPPYFTARFCNTAAAKRGACGK